MKFQRLEIVNAYTNRTFAQARPNKTAYFVLSFHAIEAYSALLLLFCHGQSKGMGDMYMRRPSAVPSWVARHCDLASLGLPDQHLVPTVSQPLARMPENGNAYQVRLVGALAGIGSGTSPYPVVAVQLTLVLGLTKVNTPLTSFTIPLVEFRPLTGCCRSWVRYIVCSSIIY